MNEETPMLEGPLESGPPMTPKSGLKTSSGQFTAIFTIVSLLISFLGWRYSAAQIENTLDLIEQIATILGPLLLNIPVLITYINSRGKIQSNAIWASATTDQAMSMAGSAGTLLPLAGGIGDFLKGKNWKDPKRYLDLAKIAGEFVPGVGAVTDRIPDGEGDTNDLILKALERLAKSQEEVDKRLAQLEDK